MATYDNDLRLKEIATGDEAGTWGTSTNTNLELIAEAMGYGTQDCFATDADATTTVADGATDPARAMYFKVTSSATLTATRTLTIAPNTVSRVMLIENATTGSQSIAISQGSGGNVTIASGQTKMVYLDGAGATGSVVDALADLELGAITVADLTATTADINGGTIDGVTIGGSSAGAGTFTTITASGEITANGGIALGDNDKARFGSSNDLEVFHDGSNSYIIDQGTGNLNIRGANLQLQDPDGYNFITAVDNGTGGEVVLYHNSSGKLATTSTGIDVTGTVTADGLDVDTGDAGNGLNYGFDVKNAASGSATSYAMPAISWANGGLRWASVHGERNPAGGYGGSFVVNTMNSAGSAVKRLGIDSNGDISFYEDTGTTAKFFWDASAESLGIGTTTTAISSKLQVTSTTTALDSGGTILASTTDSPAANIGGQVMMGGYYTGTTVAAFGGIAAKKENATDGNYAAYLQFLTSTHPTGNTEKMRIDSSGNVGIGTSSPNEKLDVVGNGKFTGNSVSINNTTSYALMIPENTGGYLRVGRDTSTGVLYGSPYANVIVGSGAYPMLFGTNNTERMRIDSSGNLLVGTTTSTGMIGDGIGLGTSSAGKSFTLFSSVDGNNGLIQFVDRNGDNALQMGAHASNIFLYGYGSRPMTFYTNGTEAMRIDSSGNVGIGTSSPSGKLHVASAGDTTVLIAPSSTGTARLNMNGTGGGAAAITSAENGLYFSNTDASPFTFSSNSTERMRIDSSGKILIGDSASQTSDLLQIETPASGGGHGIQIRRNDSNTDQGVGRIQFGNNTATDLASISARTDGATDNGALLFNTSVSGGANTERMRIDSSGNVGISNSSPAAKLDIVEATSTTAVKIKSGTSTNQNTHITMFNDNDGGTLALGVFGSSATTYGTITAADGFISSNQELCVNSQNASGAIKFGVGSTPTERMRIDSSGNLLVGTTSNSATSGEGSKFVSNGRLFQVSSYDANTQESLSMYSTGAGAYRFFVGWGGTVYATNTSISAVSDQRLKENVRDLDIGLDAVMSLKPRKFDWKEGKGANTKDARGFIAQEFEEVFPDLIDEWKDPAPEGEEPYKSVRQDLIPVLVKAIQEQQEIINDLRARVAQLEGA